MFDLQLVPLLSGAGLALASSAHCAVMCGPIAVSTRAGHGARASAHYFVGRLTTYTVLGGLSGSVGKVLLSLPQMAWIEAALSWLLAVLLARAALLQLGFGGKAGERLMTLGKGPRSSRLGRMLARVSDEPLLLGAATALLPCGALFAALTAAAALGSAAAGALSMASFAALTGLALLGVAELGRLSSWGRNYQRPLALAMLAGAALMVWRPIAVLRAEAGGELPACHGHHAAGVDAREQDEAN
jgi:sulfite exporter TauE/SafE